MKLLEESKEKQIYRDSQIINQIKKLKIPFELTTDEKLFYNLDSELKIVEIRDYVTK